MKGTIYMEDGTIYKGMGFGAEGTRVGDEHRPMAQGAEGAGGLSCGYEGDHKEAEIQRESEMRHHYGKFFFRCSAKDLYRRKTADGSDEVCGSKRDRELGQSQRKIQSGSSGFRRKAEHTQGAL